MLLKNIRLNLLKNNMKLTLINMKGMIIMKYPHITMSDELDNQIRDYTDLRKIKYSVAVTELIEYGFKYLKDKNELYKNNMLLEKIFSKEIYIKNLLEQLYSDLEIDNHTNPNENKTLNQFRNKQYKDSYID